MAVYNKFNSFVENQLISKIDWDADVFKIMLTNVSPVSTDSIKSNLVDIAAGNGYVAGGAVVPIVHSRSAGVSKVFGTDVVFNATGAVGPFQYAVLYDDTLASPVKPLVAWWAYPTPVTLANGETFTVDFDPVNGIFQLS